MIYLGEIVTGEIRFLYHTLSLSTVIPFDYFRCLYHKTEHLILSSNF